MAGLRWGIIASVSAFILSFLLGLISGNQALRVFLTALVFGFIFFGLGIGIRMFINGFFPEMVYTEAQNEDADSFEQESEPVRASPNVYGEFAVPDMYRIPGKPPELGNIEDLVSGAFIPVKETIDQKPEELYNNKEPAHPPEEDEMEDFSLQDSAKPDAPAAPVHETFVPSLGDDEGLSGLPELDSFAMVFSSDSSGSDDAGSGSPFGGGPPSTDGGYSGFSPGVIGDNEPDRSQYKGNKPQPLEGDFDAKALANGIRTALAKDK